MELVNFLNEFEDIDKRVIKVDVREPKSMFELVQKIAPEFDMIAERAIMKTGDYSFRNVGIERKESDYEDINDVLTKADELKRGFKYPFVLISCNLEDIIINNKRRGGNKISSIRGLTASLAARGVYPIFCSDKENMVRIMLKMFDKISDSKKREKFQPIRPEPTTHDWKIHVLCGLPHVGEVLAKRLLEYFGSVKDVMVASVNQLTEVEGIGKTIAEEIIEVINEDEEK